MKCPSCGDTECYIEGERVDVGFGISLGVKCEPDHCENCGYVEGDRIPMKHKQAKCTNDCDGGCWNCCCAVCEVCGCIEGSLPTDCPGVEVYREKGDDIYTGKTDYRDGQWVDGVSAYMMHAYPDRNAPVLPEGWRGFEEVS